MTARAEKALDIIGRICIMRIMRTLTATCADLYRRGSKFLDAVRVRGDLVEITRRGEVVARMGPAECRWHYDGETGYIPACQGKDSWWSDEDKSVMDFCPHCTGKIVLPGKEGDDV